MTVRSTCRVALLAAAAAFALAGCGGSSGGHNLPAASPARPTATVTFKIYVNGPSSTARRPLFVPSNPSSATIVVTPVGGVALAPVSATLQVGENTIPVVAPLGNDTFAVTLSDAHGNALAEGTTQPFDVLNDAANVVPIVLDGVPATLAVSLGGTLTVGTAASVPVTVTAYDSGGDMIVSPGNYSSALKLVDSDTSTTHLVDGAQSGASISIAASSDVVTLSYAGGAVSSATLTASVPGSAVTPVAVSFSAAAAGGGHVLYVLSTATSGGQSVNLLHTYAPGATTPTGTYTLPGAPSDAQALAADGNGHAYYYGADNLSCNSYSPCFIAVTPGAGSSLTEFGIAYPTGFGFGGLPLAIDTNNILYYIRQLTVYSISYPLTATATSSQFLVGTGDTAYVKFDALAFNGTHVAISKSDGDLNSFDPPYSHCTTDPATSQRFPMGAVSVPPPFEIDTVSGTTLNFLACVPYNGANGFGGDIPMAVDAQGDVAIAEGTVAIVVPAAGLTFSWNQATETTTAQLPATIQPPATSSPDVMSVAFDTTGNLYVADSGNNRIDVYAPPAGGWVSGASITGTPTQTITAPAGLTFWSPTALAFR